MNLKNVGSFALLLVAVACFAFGVGKSRLLTLESVAAEAEVPQTEEPNQAGVADVAKEATTRSFFESLGTWAAGIVIAAIMGIIGFFRKKIFGFVKSVKTDKGSLSAEAQDVLRIIAILGDKARPGAYFYFGHLETKTREIITYNNALVFPRAYSTVDFSDPDLPKEIFLPAIYCGDARKSLEDTMNELIKADALKISEQRFVSTPCEFADDEFSPRPIWYALTPRGREIYDEINQREKQVFKVSVVRREFRPDGIISAAVFYELRDGAVTTSMISGIEPSANFINTANNLPMITCELILPQDALLAPVA